MTQHQLFLILHHAFLVKLCIPGFSDTCFTVSDSVVLHMHACSYAAAMPAVPHDMSGCRLIIADAAWPTVTCSWHRLHCSFSRKGILQATCPCTCFSCLHACLRGMWSWGRKFPSRCAGALCLSPSLISLCLSLFASLRFARGKVHWSWTRAKAPPSPTWWWTELWGRRRQGLFPRVLKGWS